MADQEITKHTKKIYKIWSSKDHSLNHKFQEFFIEIFIIIFAVSLSIWFHSLSEKSHDRADVKTFLIGLKGDLEADIKEMQRDQLSYKLQSERFAYFESLKPNRHLDSNIVKSEFWLYNNATFLVPNISRFEALKNSGLMDKFTNKVLLDDILNLYEESIPIVVNSGKEFTVKKNEGLIKKLDTIYFTRDKNVKTVENLINTDKEFKYMLFRTVRSADFLIEKYDDLIVSYKELIKKVNAEIEVLD